jgi:hypothetical protein
MKLKPILLQFDFLSIIKTLNIVDQNDCIGFFSVIHLRLLTISRIDDRRSYSNMLSNRVPSIRIRS